MKQLFLILIMMTLLILPKAVAPATYAALTRQTIKAEPITHIGTITVTYYNLKGITASGKPVTPGHIAFSRDIIKQYRLKFGDIVHVEGLGVFVYADKMHSKWKRKCDVYVNVSRKEALKLGKHRNYVMVKKQYEKPGTF